MTDGRWPLGSCGGGATSYRLATATMPAMRHLPAFQGMPSRRYARHRPARGRNGENIWSSVLGTVSAGKSERSAHCVMSLQIQLKVRQIYLIRSGLSHVCSEPGIVVKIE